MEAESSGMKCDSQVELLAPVCDKDPVKSLTFPRKVTLGECTVRDGFQHEERFVPTELKLKLLEGLVLAGFKHVEVTNFGNPKNMPQFADADELFMALRTSNRVGDKLPGTVLTAVTIRERAVDRAIAAKRKGYGPDRILMMVSTSASHMVRNSGLDHAQYWAEAEKCIKKAHDAGIKVNGTVSTIWGCPIEGPTDLNKAVEFTKRFLSIGADDIEHADHDGSAPPDKVYEYFSKILEEIPDVSKHVAHFHVTRGWGFANVLAALQAGISRFEGCLGGIGGQPANIFEGKPVVGTGEYYYQDPGITGLICLEDLVVMLDEMGIDTGLDVEKVLELGRDVERILGRRLRSECIRTGRIPH